MADRVVRVSLVAQVNDYLANMEKVKRKNREVAGSSEDAAAKAADQGRAMNEVGTALLAAGAVATAATALAVKAAIDWESAWAGVTKTVSGTPEQLAVLQDELRELTKVLPATHEEIAAVAEAAGQLGVKTEDVAEFTKTMVMLGETTNLSATEAATQLARFMNIMGTSQDDVGRLGSAIVELGNNYATTEGEIVAMAQRLAGAGNQIGLTEGDVLGLSTALSSVGIEAQAGGSAFSKVMINIASEVENGGDKLELFAKTSGLSADEFSQKWKKEPSEALALFVQGLGAAEEQGGSTLGVLEELGITEVRMRDALLRSASASDEFTAAMKTGNDAFGENTALQEEAEKRFATTESQLRILGNTIKDAAINFGAVFLPAINGVAGALGELADFLGGLPPDFQALIGVMVGLVGVVALLGGATLIAIPKIAQFKLALVTLGWTGATTTAAMRSLATFMTGPYGLAMVAAAIGAKLLADGLESAQASADEISNSLITATSAAELFQTVGKGKDIAWLQDVKGDLEDLPNVLQASADQSANLFARFDNTHFGAFDALREIGTELGKLAQSDLPAAQDAFRMLSEEYDLSERDQWRLLSTMSDYRDALTEQATQQGINVTSSDELANKQNLIKLAMGSAQGATEENTEAVEDFKSATEVAEESVDSFVDALKGLGNEQLTLSDANRNVEKTLDDFQAALEENGATLDITEEAGRNNSKAVDDMAKAYIDQAGATVDSTKKQADAIPIIQRGRDAVIKARQALGDSQEAAEKYADALGLIPDDVQTEIRADTNEAMAAAEAFAQKLREIPNSKEVYLYVNEQRRTSGASAGQTGAAFNANGGVHSYANGGMQSYANGGEGIYSGGAPLYRFAEYETGWETFVSGKRGREKENVAYALESIRRLGHQNPAAVAGALPPVVKQSGSTKQTFILPPGLNAHDVARISRQEQAWALRG